MQDFSNLWTQDHRQLADLFAIKYQSIANKTCKNRSLSVMLPAFIYI